MAVEQVSAEQKPPHETEVRQALALFVADETGLDLSQVAPQAAFADLHIDSLAVMSIVVKMEERFGVRLANNVLTELNSLEEMTTSIVAQRLSREASI